MKTKGKGGQEGRIKRKEQGKELMAKGGITEESKEGRVQESGIKKEGKTTQRGVEKEGRNGAKKEGMERNIIEQKDGRGRGVEKGKKLRNKGRVNREQEQDYRITEERREGWRRQVSERNERHIEKSWKGRKEGGIEERKKTEKKKVI